MDILQTHEAKPRKGEFDKEKKIKRVTYFISFVVAIKVQTQQKP